MQDIHVMLDEDFSDFSIGDFPYDHEHSAMGEYHFFPEKGYKGNWFDPISHWGYRGPSWLITAPFMDGSHCMEQMRVTEPMEKSAVPILRSGDTDWTDYTVTVVMRACTKTQIAGIAFRYQTSMMHYGFFFKGDSVELHRVNKLERTVIARCPYTWDPDNFYELTVRVAGSDISCFIDDKQVLEAVDDTWSHGCIALCSCMPAQYASAKVVMDDAAFATYNCAKETHAAIVAGKTDALPKMKLWKTFDLKNFGAGRQIRFGHLTGTDELFFIICQNQKRVFKDRYPAISCMTAVSFRTGEILWQIGEPRDDENVIQLTTDLPIQVYDIDNDGIDEVITSWDFRLRILDGRTGQEKASIPTPENVEPPESVTSLEYGKYAYKRLNVDAIRIVNVSGNDRPSDIMIKDRYSRIWIYDKDLHFKWKFQKYNTGHFPYGYDFDKDGKDEIFSCYNMIDDDGRLLWSLPINTDHTDEIIIGKMDPDRDEFLAIVSGWEGFMLVDKAGNIIARDINGHGQRISAGSYRPGEQGLQICTTTYWGCNGIIYLYDCKGNELWHQERLSNGNVIAPVNWDGSGKDLILLNGDPQRGGLMDGDGDVVVRFPDDGHPTLCAEVMDLTGDNRDEILVWDRKTLCIYTQDRKQDQSEARTYAPEKYAIYNASNYRGEFHFPRWEQKTK